MTTLRKKCLQYQETKFVFQDIRTYVHINRFTGMQLSEKVIKLEWSVKVNIKVSSYFNPCIFQKGKVSMTCYQTHHTSTCRYSIQLITIDSRLVVYITCTYYISVTFQVVRLLVQSQHSSARQKACPISMMTLYLLQNYNTYLYTAYLHCNTVAA